jgi:hypothetical protein
MFASILSGSTRQRHVLDQVTTRIANGTENSCDWWLAHGWSGWRCVLGEVLV